MADGDSFGAIRTRLQEIKDKAARGAAKDPAIEALRKQLAGLQGEQAQMLQKLMERQDESEARHARDMQSLADLFMQNLEIEEKVLDRVDSGMASTLAAMEMAPAKPGDALAAKPQVIRDDARFPIIPVSGDILPLPERREDEQKGDIYELRSDDPSYDYVCATALQILQSCRFLLKDGKWAIVPTDNDITAAVEFVTGMDRQDAWAELVRSGIVLDDGVYDGSTAGGIDRGSVQPTYRLNGPLLIWYVLKAQLNPRVSAVFKAASERHASAA